MTTNITSSQVRLKSASRPNTPGLSAMLGKNETSKRLIAPEMRLARFTAAQNLIQVGKHLEFGDYEPRLKILLGVLD